MKKLYFIGALIYAASVCAEEMTPLTTSIKNRRTSIIDKTNGSNNKKKHHEQRDVRGRTRVHHAAIKGDWVALEGYLSEDDDPNARDIYGNTPLHYVVMYDTNKTNRRKAIFTLLGFGADIYSRNNRGFSPAEYADDLSFRRILLSFDQLSLSIGQTLRD